LDAALAARRVVDLNRGLDVVLGFSDLIISNRPLSLVGSKANGALTILIGLSADSLRLFLLGSASIAAIDVFLGGAFLVVVIVVLLSLIGDGGSWFFPAQGEVRFSARSVMESDGGLLEVISSDIVDALSHCCF